MEQTMSIKTILEKYTRLTDEASRICDTLDSIEAKCKSSKAVDWKNPDLINSDYRAAQAKLQALEAKINGGYFTPSLDNQYSADFRTFLRLGGKARDLETVYQNFNARHAKTIGKISAVARRLLNREIKTKGTPHAFKFCPQLSTTRRAFNAALSPFKAVANYTVVRPVSATVNATKFVGTTVNRAVNHLLIRPAVSAVNEAVVQPIFSAAGKTKDATVAVATTLATPAIKTARFAREYPKAAGALAVGTLVAFAPVCTQIDPNVGAAMYTAGAGLALTASYFGAKSVRKAVSSTAQTIGAGARFAKAHPFQATWIGTKAAVKAPFAAIGAFETAVVKTVRATDAIAEKAAWVGAAAATAIPSVLHYAPGMLDGINPYAAAAGSLAIGIGTQLVYRRIRGHLLPEKKVEKKTRETTILEEIRDPAGIFGPSKKRLRPPVPPAIAPTTAPSAQPAIAAPTLPPVQAPVAPQQPAPTDVFLDCEDDAPVALQQPASAAPTLPAVQAPIAPQQPGLELLQRVVSNGIVRTASLAPSSDLKLLEKIVSNGIVRIASSH